MLRFLFNSTDRFPTNRPYVYILFFVLLAVIRWACGFCFQFVRIPCFPNIQRKSDFMHSPCIYLELYIGKVRGITGDNECLSICYKWLPEAHTFLWKPSLTNRCPDEIAMTFIFLVYFFASGLNFKMRIV